MGEEPFLYFMLDMEIIVADLLEHELSPHFLMDRPDGPVIVVKVTSPQSRKHSVAMRFIKGRIHVSNYVDFRLIVDVNSPTAIDDIIRALKEYAGYYYDSSILDMEQDPESPATA